MKPPRNPMKLNRPVKPKKQSASGPKCVFCGGHAKSNSEVFPGENLLACKSCHKAGLAGTKPEQWQSTEDPKQCIAELRYLAEQRRIAHEIVTTPGSDPRWSALWIE